MMIIVKQEGVDPPKYYAGYDGESGAVFGRKQNATRMMTSSAAAVISQLQALRYGGLRLMDQKVKFKRNKI